MTRVATANSMDRSLELIGQRQRALQEAQLRLTSGKRVERASDDPTAAARAERALAQTARADASQRALEASRNAMVQAESALGDAGDLVQQARELLVQAGNPAYNDAQRKTLAEALRGLRAQLLQVANRGDGAGGHLFGGQGTGGAPFVDAAGGVQYRATTGQMEGAAGEALPMTVDGDAAWLRAASGNGVFVTAPAAGNGGGAWIDAGTVADPSALTGDPYQVIFTRQSDGRTTYALTRNGAATAVTAAPYVAGQAIQVDGLSFAINGTPADGEAFDLTPSTREQSIFTVLQGLADTLGVPDRSGAQVAQTVSSGLRDIDQSLNLLIAVRSGLGETLQRTDAVEGRLAESKLQAQGERSAAEDLDMAAAVSEFSTRQTSYDAALKAYSMVQRMSLFEYLR